MIKIRSGIGYDIHRLEPGNNGIILGGLRIPFDKQAIAHSDGDILSHAIIDSLLGAIGEPDIGEQFPDSNPLYKGISSLELLSRTREILDEQEFEIINIDSVIVAEKPPISPYKAAIKENIARVLRIPPKDINIKGKTKEKMDAAGRGEAIECFAISMIRSRYHE